MSIIRKYLIKGTFWRSSAKAIHCFPVTPASSRLSIIVPIYNEERTLPTLISRLLAACGEWSQVIYVDDGSKDASLAIARAHARPQDTVVTKSNGGKGSAVRAGIPLATGTYTIVQDADLEYSPEEIPRLLEFAEKNGHVCVFGSRRLKRQKQYVHILSFLGGSMLTWICNLLYGTRLTDQPTCYKLVRTDVLRGLGLVENDFRFDPEITVKVLRAGHAIHEFPISYTPRTRAEGKKIWWKDWFLWVSVFLKLWPQRQAAGTPVSPVPTAQV